MVMPQLSMERMAGQVVAVGTTREPPRAVSERKDKGMMAAMVQQALTVLVAVAEELGKAVELGAQLTPEMVVMG
jgi:hypothetical protein